MEPPALSTSIFLSFYGRLYVYLPSATAYYLLYIMYSQPSLEIHSSNARAFLSSDSFCISHTYRYVYVTSLFSAQNTLGVYRFIDSKLSFEQLFYMKD